MRFGGGVSAISFSSESGITESGESMTLDCSEDMSKAGRTA